MPLKSAYEERIPANIFLFLGIYSLLPFLILTAYNHPSLDDFGLAIRDRNTDLLSTQIHYYLNWSGRYFSTFISRINPLLCASFNIYKFYSFVFILLISTSLFWLVYTLLKTYFILKRILALSALFTSLILIQIPDIAECLFWLTGYLGYQLPIILIFFTLIVLTSFYRSQQKFAKIKYIAIASILCLAIAGASEMPLVILITTISFIIYNSWKQEKQHRKYLVYLFLICLMASAIAILAPGNYVRMQQQPFAARPIWSVLYASFLTVSSFYRWSFPVLLASILYIFYWGIPLADKTKTSNIFAINLKLAVVYYLATLFLMHFLFTWSTGERPTPRVENVIYLFFVLGWFYVLQVALNKYAHFLVQERKLSPFIPNVVLLLFVLNVLNIDNNISTAYIDLISGKVIIYDQQLMQRYAYIQTSNCQICAIEPLRAIPKSLYLRDILPGEVNAHSDINQEIADYWKISGIYLQAPNAEILDNTTTLKEMRKYWLEGKAN